DDEECLLFSAACQAAHHSVQSFLQALSDNGKEALLALETVFGTESRHTDAAKDTFKKMADVLFDWQQAPKKCLKLEPMAGFLRVGGKTIARQDYFVCTGYAQILLPSLLGRGVSLTLIHESAHGASSEITDIVGYRKTNPASFYSASNKARLQ